MEETVQNKHNFDVMKSLSFLFVKGVGHLRNIVFRLIGVSYLGMNHLFVVTWNLFYFFYFINEFHNFFKKELNIATEILGISYIMDGI